MTSCTSALSTPSSSVVYKNKNKRSDIINPRHPKKTTAFRNKRTFSSDRSLFRLTLSLLTYCCFVCNFSTASIGSDDVETSSIISKEIPTIISRNKKGRGNALERRLDVETWVQVGGDLGGENYADYFGYSIDMNDAGTRIVIGAPNDSEFGSYAGRAVVLEEIDGYWVQVGEPLLGEASEDDFFGTSVAINDEGTRVIIGGYKHDENGSNSGHARVFEEIVGGGSWVQVGESLNGEAVGDYFGKSVAMNDKGTRIIIGAPKNDANGFENSGHARVFEERDGNWVQVGENLEGEADDDEAGERVAMNKAGTRVIVAAPDSDQRQDYAGLVRVFEEVGDEKWVQVGRTLYGKNIQDYFGISVAMNDAGTRIIIGVMEFSFSKSGQAEVFEEIDGNWVPVGKDLEGEANSDDFGYSVDMNGEGDRVVVGGRFTNVNGLSNAGHSRVFEERDGKWVQVGGAVEGEGADDRLGFSVAMNKAGTRTITGGLGGAGRGYIGLARVFETEFFPCETIGSTTSCRRTDGCFWQLDGKCRSCSMMSKKFNCRKQGCRWDDSESVCE